MTWTKETITPGAYITFFLGIFFYGGNAWRLYRKDDTLDPAHYHYYLEELVLGVWTSRLTIDLPVTERLVRQTSSLFIQSGKTYITSINGIYSLLLSSPYTFTKISTRKIYYHFFRKNDNEWYGRYNDQVWKSTDQGANWTQLITSNYYLYWVDDTGFYVVDSFLNPYTSNLKIYKCIDDVNLILIWDNRIENNGDRIYLIGMNGLTDGSLQLFLTVKGSSSVYYHDAYFYYDISHLIQSCRVKHIVNCKTPQKCIMIVPPEVVTAFPTCKQTIYASDGTTIRFQGYLESGENDTVTLSGIDEEIITKGVNTSFISKKTSEIFTDALGAMVDCSLGTIATTSNTYTMKYSDDAKWVQLFSRLSVGEAGLFRSQADGKIDFKLLSALTSASLTWTEAETYLIAKQELTRPKLSGIIVKGGVSSTGALQKSYGVAPFTTISIVDVTDPTLFLAIAAQLWAQRDENAADVRQYRIGYPNSAPFLNVGNTIIYSNAIEEIPAATYIILEQYYELVDSTAEYVISRSIGARETIEDNAIKMTLTSQNTSDNTSGTTKEQTSLVKVLAGLVDIDLVPDVTETRKLGSATNVWDEIYVADATQPLHAMNEQSVLRLLGSQRPYYFIDTASDISGYKVMSADYVSASAATVTASSLGAGETLIYGWATIAGVPGVTTLPAGDRLTHIWAYKQTGSKDVVLRSKLYKYSGGVETLLATSEDSIIITNVNIAYDMRSYLAQTTVLASDRFIIKLYAYVSGSGVAPNVTVTFLDLTYSGYRTPTGFLSQYVTTNGSNTIGASHSMTEGKFSNPQQYKHANCSQSATTDYTMTNGTIASSTVDGHLTALTITSTSSSCMAEGPIITAESSGYVSVWFRFNNATKNYYPIIANDDLLWQINCRSCALTIYDGTNTTSTLATLNINTWYHIRIYWIKAGKVLLYVNDQYVGESVGNIPNTDITEWVHFIDNSGYVMNIDAFYHGNSEKLARLSLKTAPINAESIFSDYTNTDELHAKSVKVLDTNNYKGTQCINWGTSGTPTTIIAGTGVDTLEVLTSVAKNYRNISTLHTYPIHCIEDGSESIRTDTSTTMWSFWIAFASASSQTYVGLQDSAGVWGALLLFQTDGQIFSYKFAISDWVLIGKYTANEWKHVKIDYVSGTSIRVYLDDNMVNCQLASVPSRTIAYHKIESGTTDNEFWVDAWYSGTDGILASLSMSDKQTYDDRWTPYGLRGWHYRQYVDEGVWNAQYSCATNGRSVILDFLNGHSASVGSGITETTAPSAIVPPNSKTLLVQVEILVDSANSANYCIVSNADFGITAQGLRAWGSGTNGFTLTYNLPISVNADGHVKLWFGRGAGTLTAYVKILGYEL